MNSLLSLSTEFFLVVFQTDQFIKVEKPELVYFSRGFRVVQLAALQLNSRRGSSENVFKTALILLIPDRHSLLFHSDHTGKLKMDVNLNVLETRSVSKTTARV